MEQKITSPLRRALEEAEAELTELKHTAEHTRTCLVALEGEYKKRVDERDEMRRERDAAIDTAFTMWAACVGAAGDTSFGMPPNEIAIAQVREYLKQLTWSRAIAEQNQPIPMILHCPECGERHIDEGEFAMKGHTTHACQHCGMVWKPAQITTVGVRFLPGYKNDK